MIQWNFYNHHICDNHGILSVIFGFIELLNAHVRLVGNRIYVMQHHWKIYEHIWVLVCYGVDYVNRHCKCNFRFHWTVECACAIGWKSNICCATPLENLWTYMSTSMLLGWLCQPSLRHSMTLHFHQDEQKLSHVCDWTDG